MSRVGTSMPAKNKKVAIIGAEITGLTAVFELKKKSVRRLDGFGSYARREQHADSEISQNRVCGYGQQTQRLPN